MTKNNKNLLKYRLRFAIVTKTGKIIKEFYFKQTAIQHLKYYELYPGELEVIDLND